MVLLLPPKIIQPKISKHAGRRLRHTLGSPLLPANDFPARAEAQRLVDRLSELGARALGEFLDELARSEGVTDATRQQLERYAELTPEMLQAVGADQWTPAPTRLIRGDQ